MNYMRIALVVVLCVMLAGCAARQVVVLATEILMPEGWPEISEVVFGDSECPAISGIYSESPLQWSSPGSFYKDVTYEQYGYITVLPFRLSHDNEQVTSSIPFEDGEFLVVQNDSNQFLFLNKSLSGEVSEDVFSEEEGDYQCQDSRMSFPRQIVYGAGEGGSFNHQFQKYLVVDEAGDLVLVRITGPYMSSLMGLSPKFEFDFLKYKKIRNLGVSDPAVQ